MHLTFRNVNDSFRGLVEGIHTGTIPTHVCASRYGEVMMVEEPVIVTYSHPRERVLFNKARDVNSFFHLYEALWMLAGRNDVAPLAYYASRMKEFSDNGKILNGAYGYRWRHATKDAGLSTHVEIEDFDQLKVIIDHLKAQPESRRAVLAMWNVEDDLLKIGMACEKCKGYGSIYAPDGMSHDLDDDGQRACPDCHGKKVVNQSKDVCCNLDVCFSLRTESSGFGDVDALDSVERKLDMTVFNRSNDLIWGMLGANVVHFSILQEYMAAHLGVEVGRYNQVTNNLHVYANNFKPEEWLADTTKDVYTEIREFDPTDFCKPFEVVQDPAAFDKQLHQIVDYFDGSGRDGMISCHEITEPFLWDVVRPMLSAFQCYKRNNLDAALDIVEHQVAADDWRVAAEQWLLKRKEKRDALAKQYGKQSEQGG